MTNGGAHATENVLHQPDESAAAQTMRLYHHNEVEFT